MSGLFHVPLIIAIGRKANCTSARAFKARGGCFLLENFVESFKKCTIFKSLSKEFYFF